MKNLVIALIHSGILEGFIKTDSWNFQIPVLGMMEL